PYGVVACELDGEALQNDSVSLIHARGVMPDGLPFDIPASDPPVAPLPIRDRFSPTSDSHLVLLAIPAYRPDQSNFTQNGSNGFEDAATRYTAQSTVVRDDMTGRDERTLTIGRKNFRLMLDSDPGVESEHLVTMPLARVRRDGAGHFIYDADYIAPSLHIAASPRLMNMLHRLIEVLEAKADSIGRGRRGSSDEFAQKEVASFWLLHAIHASAPTLRNYLEAKRVHPERLYVELARLAGALCTFALDGHPRTLLPYDHDRPEAGFDALDRHIRANLEVVAPTTRTTIPFVAAGPNLHSCVVRDARAYGPARWIIGVRASLTGNDLVARVPALTKVCSKKFVGELVRRAYPGLRLDHMPFPPAQISPRSDTQYFAIERAGPCWDTIVSTQEVGVFAPDAIPDAQFELAIVIEGGS
ncbi:MAG TPA: type VI secretion system baseplate subunit TssK, partial [Gemmatimonadaceae bacterium]